MKFWLTMAVLLAVSACGVETVGTAATGAAIKKQELEQGKKTMEQMQNKLDQANQQTLQRTETAGGDK